MEQQNTGSKRTTSSGSGKIAAKSYEAAEHLKEAVVGQVSGARDRAQSAKDQASDRIRRAASQLRGVSDTLREDDPLLAGLAERASDGVESVARYVSAATPQSIVNDTERLARRQPALFYGAAFLLGLAAGRFIKSSRPASWDDEGQSFARREYEGSARQPGERESGFFAGPNQVGRDNPRFRENYDAAFGRDAEGRNAEGRNVEGRNMEGRNMEGREPDLNAPLRGTAVAGGPVASPPVGGENQTATGTTTRKGSLS